jgi:hypothetical protein
MPSVHFAWALLAAVKARRLSGISQMLFTTFAALTAFATIALGEHYLIDLVVAVPFTLAIHAACDRDRPSLVSRRQAVVFGAVATSLWFLFLRLWTPPSAISPGLCILSVVTIAATVPIYVGYCAIRPGSGAVRRRYASPPRLALPER